MGTVRNARVNQGGPKCAGIVGLGLIGGSFARGYAQAGVRVLAWDPDDDVMTAASMGTVAGELNDETLGECDIIVLAAILKDASSGSRPTLRRSPTPPTPMHHGPRGDRHRGCEGHRV